MSSPPMMVSARALAQAKQRHTAVLHSYPITSELRTEAVNHENRIINPPYEQMRSYAEMKARKEYHRYVPQQHQHDRQSVHNNNTNTTTTTTTFYTPRSIVLATGERMTTAPNTQGHVHTSHRAFSAAKIRHYTPVNARMEQQQHDSIHSSRCVTPLGSARGGAPVRRVDNNASSTVSHRVVQQQQHQQVEPNYHAQRYEAPPPSYATYANNNNTTTSHYHPIPAAGRRSQTPNTSNHRQACIVGQGSQSRYNLSYGAFYIPEARSGRRTYVMPRAQTEF